MKYFQYYKKHSFVYWNCNFYFHPRNIKFYFLQKNIFPAQETKLQQINMQHMITLASV